MAPARPSMLILLAVAATTCRAEPPADCYPNHSQLLVFADESGTLQTVGTPADWRRRREDILQGMEAAMGPLPRERDGSEFDLRQTEEQSGAGFVRKTYTLAVESNHSAARGSGDAVVDRLPLDLYLPTPLRDGERRAAVLALHPTGRPGKRLVGSEGAGTNRQYAVELAQRGYVVLAPDYPSFGESSEYNFNADRYDSGTMKGIVNHRRCVDLLQSLPQVDPQRIGVIGHSLGGHNALFVAAFDERIQAIVSSCGWTPFHDYYGGKLAGWTSDRYMPRIRDVYGLDPDRVPFDFYEVVAALAPRPFLSCSPVEDANFDIGGVEKAIARAREVYALLGAPEALQLRTPQCGHDFPTETRLEAYAFLDRALDHAPTGLIDYSSELPRIAPLSPAEAPASIQTLPGYEIQQTAAEPLVVDPVAMCFDASGRLYVVEMCDYSEQETERLGRVSLLTDLDGDGKFDRSQLFADGLSWPTAITCYDDGVFVGAPPDIHYLKDTDGDGQADERRVVFTGFGRSNVQGLMNSLQWGLDNRIHGATSSSGGVVSRPDDPGFKPVDLRGRDFSFDPRKFDLRPESGGGQHGMCFDDWGRKFVCSNSDHCQMVMYEDRYIARNPDFPAPGPRVSIATDGPQAAVFRSSPVEPWRIVRTRLRASGVVPGIVEGGGQPAGYFTGATGITIYRGDALPELRGMAIIGDVGSNLVHRKRLVPDGVGFRAERIDADTEFVRSRDIWFRPVQFANGPDGCLHILDMYREVIEHPKSLPPEIKQHLDLTSGRDRGRLYRVVPDGFAEPKLPDWTTLSTAELLQVLASPNAWSRTTASRLIFERSNVSEAELHAVLRSGATPLSRLHALYALSGAKALTYISILAGLDDEDGQVRRHAVRLAEQFGTTEQVRLRLTEMVQDADVSVRFQLALAAGEFDIDWRVPVVASLLLRDGADPWVRTAALSSLDVGAGAVLCALMADAAFVAEPFAVEVVSPLARLVGRQNVQHDLHAVLSAVQQPVAATGGVAETVILGLADGNSRLRTQLKGTPAGETLARILDDARARGRDESANVTHRAAATRLLRLGDWEQDGETLAALLDPRQPAELQSAAVGVLATFATPAATELLLAQWSRLSPTVRREAEEAICSRAAGALALLSQLESKTIPPADLSPGRLQLLAASKDVAVKTRAAALVQRLGTSTRQQVVDQYREALSLRGDVERGRAAFRKTCAACHKLDGVGYELGPNLATLKNRGPEAMLLNVLDPNREVNPQYQTYLAVTSDGLTHTGMIQSETATAVTLSRGENKTETILRSDLEDLRSTGLSLMPEGLEKEVDVATLADLLEFLSQTR